MQQKVKRSQMDPKTELLLYIASRRQHLVEKVLPALEAGKLVIMDRFIDSSLAYQGFGRGLNIDAIDWLNQFATDGLKPDLTLYFDKMCIRDRLWPLPIVVLSVKLLKRCMLVSRVCLFLCAIWKKS